MKEEWNKALEQVEDGFLQEAADYRPRVPAWVWTGAAAAVVALTVGWFTLRSDPAPLPPTSSEPVLQAETTSAPPQYGITGESIMPPEATPGNMEATAGEADSSPEGTDFAMGVATGGSAVSGGGSYSVEELPNTPLPPTDWMDISQATLLPQVPPMEGTITEIGADYFLFTTDEQKFRVSGSIGGCFAIGERVLLTCKENVYYHEPTGRYAAAMECLQLLG